MISSSAETARKVGAMTMTYEIGQRVEAGCSFERVIVDDLLPPAPESNAERAILGTALTDSTPDPERPGHHRVTIQIGAPAHPALTQAEVGANLSDIIARAGRHL